LWPDQYVAWVFRVLRKVRLEKYDRVILWLRPESLLLLPLFRRNFDHWTIDCQEVFYPVYTEKRRSPIPWILSPFLVMLQRYGFGKSKNVFFTSDFARKEYVKLGVIAADKTKHIPLFFDEGAYKNAQPSSEQFTIAYFGSFGFRSGARSPEPFFEALGLFLERNPIARSQMKCLFYGNSTGRIDSVERGRLIERYGEEKGRQVKYAEAFEITEYGGQPSPEQLKEMFPF